MKVRCVLFVIICLLFSLPVAAKNSASHKIAEEVSSSTLTAISPLLTLSVKGFNHWRDPGEQSASRPLYASPLFWIPGFLLLLFIFGKDSVGQFFPGATKPLDVIDTTVNKFFGIAGSFVSIPELCASLEKPVGTVVSVIFHNLLPVSTAYAASTDVVPANEPVVQMITSFSSVVLGAVGYILIWLASNTVNVLTLISPIPFTGTILKSVRLGVLFAITLLTIVHPYLGLLVSVITLYYAYRIAGWSLRLTVFGAVFAKDYLWSTWKRTHVDETSDIRAFSAVAMERIPVRTYGIVRHEKEGVLFTYRPWMVGLRRKALLTEQCDSLYIGKALLNPSIIQFNEKKQYTILCNLPPRYKQHETEIATVLRMHPDVQDISILKGFRAAWQWIKGQFQTIKRGEIRQRQASY